MRILIILGMGGIAVLLLIFGVHLQAQNAAKKESITTNGNEVNEVKVAMTPQMEQLHNRQQASRGEQRRSEDVKTDDGTDFYKVIIDNNIFRPLGWKPPNREPEYTLIGTAFDPSGGRSEVFILEERSKKFYIAGVGEKIGDAIVKEIEQKKVILEKGGERITLRSGSVQFLKSGGSRRSNSSASYEPSNRNESNNNKSSSSKSSDRDKSAAMLKAKEAAEAKMKREWMERAQEYRRRFEGASREDRERMRREFSRRRGGRGGDR